MNNKIIETQELLFKEMKRIDATEGLENEEAQLEFDRASALYTTSTCFIKAINTNINIRIITSTSGTIWQHSCHNYHS